MPKATVDVNATERHELSTLPATEVDEAGFVVLKRMTYAEFLQRRDMISKMSMEGQGKSTKAIMELANEVVTRHEFTTCIVDHNLEDDNGNPLDFRSKRALAVLDPRVGEEISSLIDKMNKWDELDGVDPLESSED